MFHILGGLALTIVKGPLEAVLGVVYGLVFGVILWYIPHGKHVSSDINFTIFYSSLLSDVLCTCYSTI